MRLPSRAGRTSRRRARAGRRRATSGAIFTRAAARGHLGESRGGGALAGAAGRWTSGGKCRTRRENARGERRHGSTERQALPRHGGRAGHRPGDRARDGGRGRAGPRHRHRRRQARGPRRRRARDRAARRPRPRRRSRRSPRGWPTSTSSFNCAGFVEHGTILDTDEESWAFSFDLNVTAMYRMIRAFLPACWSRAAARSSTSPRSPRSIVGVPNRCAYGATKAAVIGLTKSVAADFVDPGHPLQLHLPGHRRQPVAARSGCGAQGDYETARKAFVARQPMGRIGTARGDGRARGLPRLRRERLHHRRRARRRRRHDQRLTQEGNAHETAALRPAGGREAGPARRGRQDPRPLRPRRRHRRRHALATRASTACAGSTPRSCRRSIPAVRLGPCVAGTGKFVCIGLNYSDHAAETGATRAARADHLHEGDQRHLRPGRPGHHPARLAEDRLGGRARLRHRQAREVRRRGRRARPRRRLLPGQRRLRARLPGRAPGPVVQGQVGRPLRPDRPLARHPRRGRRPAEAADVAEGQRRDPPGRLDRDHGLRGEVPGQPTSASS